MSPRLRARGRCGWRRNLVPGRRSSRCGGTAGARSFSQNRARRGNYKARRDRRILMPSRSSSVPPISPRRRSLRAEPLHSARILHAHRRGLRLGHRSRVRRDRRLHVAPELAGQQVRGAYVTMDTPRGACQAERRCGSGRPWREAGSRRADEPEASYAEPIGAQPPAVIHSGVSAR